MAANGRHGNATPRWGTPADIVERSRRTMGGISLDPCSEAQFQEVVKADTWYSLIDRGEDGLKLPWFGSMFVNPPGGLVDEFWERLLMSEIDQAIWVGFSVEQFSTLIDAPAHPLDFSTCLVRKRIKFRHHAKKDAPPAPPCADCKGTRKCPVHKCPDCGPKKKCDLHKPDRPSHANYITGLGVDHAKFEKEFGPLGKIIRGPLVQDLP